MRKNRYESSSFRASRVSKFLDVGPAWWGLTIVASVSFVLAIAWLLTANPV
jgi:hypothetical protein